MMKEVWVDKACKKVDKLYPTHKDGRVWFLGLYWLMQATLMSIWERGFVSPSELIMRLRFP